MSLPEFLFTDVDDTLTTNGRLLPETYSALWRLYEADIKVIPVTGGCAGWCDQIMRTWPVVAVIGEGGAFYIKNDNSSTSWNFWFSKNQHKLDQSEIFKKINSYDFGFDISYSKDQDFRLADVAIDYNQEAKLNLQEVGVIKNYLTKEGYEAKKSSIHINVVKGNFDKAKMSRRYLEIEHSIHIEDKGALDKIYFIGDAPNDECMFKMLKNTYGVGNIKKHLENMEHKPARISEREAGLGFADIVEEILRG